MSEPTLEQKCWLEGIAACEQRVDRDRNPYVGGAVVLCTAWYGGYDFASAVIAISPRPNHLDDSQWV